MSLFSEFLEAVKQGSANHHAYGIEGGEVHKTTLHTLLSESGSEVHLIEHESFGIDEGRSLQSLALLRPQGNADKKRVIVLVRSFTKEAQNALLKLFEEPTQSTQFFIFFPAVDQLLPTLQSRLQIVRQNLGQKQDDIQDERVVMREFLAEGPGARLARVKSFLDLLEKEKITKAHLEKYLNALEVELHRSFHLLRGKGDEKTLPLSLFEKALSVIQYAPDRSSSMKMIFETLAVVLPVLPVLQGGK